MSEPSKDELGRLQATIKQLADRDAEAASILFYLRVVIESWRNEAQTMHEGHAVFAYERVLDLLPTARGAE